MFPNYSLCLRGPYFFCTKELSTCGPRSRGAPAATADDGVEPATEADEVASEDLPVPKEMLEQLNVLRGKKKYLEEIKELEMAVRALQEEQAAGFPPEVEPPVLGDEGDEGDEGAGDAAPEPAAE